MQQASKLPRAIIWGLIFPLIVLNGWLFLLVIGYFQPLVSTFIAATLLAFILDYPVQFLQERGEKRIRAVFWVLLLTSIILIAVAITLVPIVLEQLNELINRLPSWIDSGTQQLQTFQNWAMTQNLPINLGGLAAQLTERLSNQLQIFTGQLLSLALGTIDSVLNVSLTLVLTFYMVLQGEQVWDGIYKWFPAQLGENVRESLRENFHNYFIGQATLASILGLATTFAFLLLKVPLAILFGLTIGFLALFPFGTGFGIALVGLLVTLQNFWQGIWVVAIAILLDQINSNFIAPRVLGGFTGLSPVWILVSLLAGAKIGGLLGLLMAVPLSSFIKSTADNLRNNKLVEVTVPAEEIQN